LIYGCVCATGVVATFEYKFKECIEIVGNPAQVTAPHSLFWLRVIFGRTRSRWIGSLGDVGLPVALRAPLFRFFAWAYDVNLEEVRYPLDSYQTFNDFFSRKLKDGVRPIAAVPSGLVSPVDAQVLRSGIIDSRDARIDQVKGTTYGVVPFLGHDPVETASAGAQVRFVVLYLAHGNYHRVHSPCQVTFTSGRHFCGELLPMMESFLKRFNDVFAVNERVVLSGRWKYGQMHMVAVAAANIGSIYLEFDEKLKTNRLRDITVHCGGDISSKLYPEGVDLAAGDPLGGFRMGSTVVLVFETSGSFKWEVSEGDKVLVGQPLGREL